MISDDPKFESTNVIRPRKPFNNDEINRYLIIKYRRLFKEGKAGKN